MAVAELSAERLRSLLSYDPETGALHWLQSRGTAKKGSLAGAVNSEGYVLVMIDKRSHGAHRLAWLHTTGEWPAQEVDHRDGERQNNRWVNLREASPQMNRENQRHARAGGSIGLLGVSRKRKRFVANIMIEGKYTKLPGSYATPEEAHAAYVEVKRVVHKGNTL